SRRECGASDEPGRPDGLELAIDAVDRLVQSSHPHGCRTPELVQLALHPSNWSAELVDGAEYRLYAELAGHLCFAGFRRLFEALSKPVVKPFDLLERQRPVVRNSGVVRAHLKNHLTHDRRECVNF